MKFAVWPLYLSAPMLGLGQSILLILTPILVDKIHIELPMLAIIMSLGSGLFFFSAPFWAKVSQTRGLRTVLNWGVMGFSASFALLYFSLLFSSFEASLVLLIFARLVYGFFASAIVPTTQAWLINNNQVDVQKPLAKLSVVLATSRLIAPYLGALLLGLHEQAPLLFLSLIPLIALVGVNLTQPNPIQPIKAYQKEAQHKHQLYLYVALISQCASYIGLCYLLTPICTQWLALAPNEASQMLASLMTLAAATMLLCHLTLTKLKISNHLLLITLSLLTSMLACVLIWLNTLPLLYLGIVLLSASFAVNQVSVTTSLCIQVGAEQRTNATASVAKYQTLGYTLGALLLWLTDASIQASLFAVLILLSISLGLTLVDASKSSPSS